MEFFMARMFLNVLLIVFLSSQLTAQNISIRDFVIPESRYKNMFGSIRGNYGNTRQGYPWYENESHRGEYSLALTNVSGFNSENTAYEINSALQGAYYHNSSSTDNKNNYLPRLSTSKN